MKSASVALLSLVALLALHGAQATISCYVCAGTTAISATSDCWPTVTYDASSNSSIDTVTVATGCTSCLTTKSTAASVTTYARSCSTASSSSVKTGCTTVSSVTSCVYSCTTDLCNKTSFAPVIRYSLLTIISALFLSVLGKRNN